MNQDSIDVERPVFHQAYTYEVDKLDGVDTDDTQVDLSDLETPQKPGDTLELAGEEFEVEKELYSRKGCKVIKLRRQEDKQILIAKITDKPENNSSASIHLTYEIQFYKKLKHLQDSHLVTIKNAIPTRNKFVRLMEYACRGDLTQYIPSTAQNSTKSQKDAHLAFVKNILWQVLKGIEQVHNLGYAYRDLKPSNILIDHNGAVKICDFGLVVPLGMVDASISGTPEYMSPERLSSKRASLPIDPSVDFWSLGILAYQLMMGYTPYYYEDDNIEELLESMYGGYISFDQDFPSQCRHFIFNLLQTNPARRMKLQQIKQHNFFKDFQQKPIISQRCKCQTRNSRS